MKMGLGLLLGAGWAVADAMLLRLITRTAARAPARAGRFLAQGLAARYLLTAAVLVFGLLLHDLFDPLWIILPLIVQKAVLAVVAFWKSK